MKLTKRQLRRIIREVAGDVSLQVEYLDWENAYDQTEWTIRINGKEMVVMTSGGSSDPEGEAEYVAENAMSELFDDDEDHPDEEQDVMQALLDNPKFVSDVEEASIAVQEYAEGLHDDSW
jgi:hypothetical protein